LIRYFELDAFRLESIINDNVDEGRQVERDDIALLAMSGLREEYLVMRLKDGNGAEADGNSHGRSLRRYLYDKYVYRSADSHNGATAVNGARDLEINDAVFPPEGGVRVQITPPVS
jgi:hypothetical protein